MKKMKVSYLFLILFLIGSMFTIIGDSYSSSDPNWYLIKVYVYKEGNVVGGALVRCTGPNFDQCGVTSSSGTCAFYPDNSGTYNICASSNGWHNTATRDVPPNADVRIDLVHDYGACEDCPGSK